MGQIFISYSHKDSDYAHQLASALQARGMEVWIDARLDYGSQWPHEIEKHLDACTAFILIMSPRAFASDWVQSELQRAKRKYKPIFPLLLEGDGPWLSVESTQYYDVRDGRIPDERFFSAIKRSPAVSQSSQTYPHLSKPIIQNKPPQPDPVPVARPEPRFRTEIWVAVIGAVATLCAACLTIGAPFALEYFKGGDAVESPVVIVTATPDLDDESNAAGQATDTPQIPEAVEATRTPESAAPAVSIPTWTSPPSGTCRDGYVYRLINQNDKVCVSPQSKQQADADNAADDSRKILASLVNAYGENACAYGYRWRNLFEGDLVCVSGTRYNQIQNENANSPAFKAADGVYCISGYVWRVAYDADLVCVTPEQRDQTAVDNSEAAIHMAVNVYDGSECLDGYVHRKAFAGDLVCVTPAIRDQVKQDNASAPSHTWP